MAIEVKIYWLYSYFQETYESFHYTSLLYLADYGRDFEGGRFVFIDRDSNKTVEPRQGKPDLWSDLRDILKCSSLQNLNAKVSSHTLIEL